jgi:RNA polymerase-binding transcription factor DksA
MSTRPSSISREWLDSIRRKLLDRQRALFDDVDGLEAELRIIEESREAEFEARSQGASMARVLDRVRERDRHELEELYRALAKIPAGVYGVCTIPAIMQQLGKAGRSSTARSNENRTSLRT